MAFKLSALQAVKLCARGALLMPAALLIRPTIAHADPSGAPPRIVRLEYSRSRGALDCPDEDTFRFAVAGRMSFNPFVAQSSERLIVNIARKGAAYQGRAEIRDDAGEVRWSFPTAVMECHLVTDALALAIGLELDPPRRKVQTPPPAPDEEAPAPPVAPPVLPAPKAEAPPAPHFEPAELPPTPPSATLPPRESLRLNLGVSGAVALRSVAPAFGSSVAAAVGLRWRAFSAAGEFRWTPPILAAGDAAGNDLVHVQQLSGGFVPCGHVHGFFFCGTGQVIAVVAQGAPAVRPRSLTAVTPATGARVGWDLPLPVWGQRFAVRLSADVLATLRNVEIQYSDSMPPAWTSARVTAALSAGFVTDLGLK